MEELKLLVNMVANLPSMALWVIAFFFAYKVTIIGSIYGVIRLAIQRAYEYGTSPNRHKMTIERKEIHLEDILNGICISSDDTKHCLIRLLKKVAENNSYHVSAYIHKGTVEWMEEAINSQILADVKKAQK
jgi:hypothetical protein